MVITTPRGGQSDPQRWSIGPPEVVNRTLRGGQSDPRRWSTGPPKVVNRTPGGGQPDPQRWSTGPQKVVITTPNGSTHHPKWFDAPAQRVRRTTPRGWTHHLGRFGSGPLPRSPSTPPLPWTSARQDCRRLPTARWCASDSMAPAQHIAPVPRAPPRRPSPRLQGHPAAPARCRSASATPAPAGYRR